MEIHNLLDKAPAPHFSEDTWARLCCELAISALEKGNYAVGAVLVNGDDQLISSAGNNVFSDGFRSDRHAEMEVLTQFETLSPEVDRSALTLYVSLEPCVMCYGRILLSGIINVRYLAKDKSGGFADHIHLLPSAWRDLASRVSVKQMDANTYWKKLSAKLVNEYQDRNQMRQKIKAAWVGQLPH